MLLYLLASLYLLNFIPVISSTLSKAMEFSSTFQLYTLSFILKSINQNPSDYIALNTLGLCYLAMKQYEDAKKIIEFPAYHKTKVLDAPKKFGKMGESL